MAEMVRLATLRRGLDPRDFVLVAYGGAGPLHAARIADEVGIPQVVIPPYPGMFSATGALLGTVRHDLVQTQLVDLNNTSPEQILEGFSALEKRAKDLLAEESAQIVDTQCQRLMDLRYRGQLFDLQIAVGSTNAELPVLSDIERRFRSQYLDTYGYELEKSPVELVNLRLIASHHAPPINLARPHELTGGKTIKKSRSGAPVLIKRDQLHSRQPVPGPAIVFDEGATVQVLEKQLVRSGPAGTIIIEASRIPD